MLNTNTVTVSIPKATYDQLIDFIRGIADDSHTVLEEGVVQAAWIYDDDSWETLFTWSGELLDQLGESMD